MGTRFLLDLPDVLVAAGLEVTVQAGWDTRARSSGGFDGTRPWCIMWHHAASAPGASTASVANYASYGSDTAPICNLVVGRAGDVIVCAAGATNTNGKGNEVPCSLGVVPSDSMNTHAIGIEAVNSGVGEPWPQAQIDAYFTINNALAAAYGLQPTDCCTHNAYAPGRKIDPATADAVEGPWMPQPSTTSGTWWLDDIRAEAVRRAPKEEPDMTDEQARQLEALYSTMTVAQPGFTDPGGAPLNAGWAALWGYFLVAGDIYKMLVDIQTRIAALEARPP
jgi:hypothetical protein